ncbi:hydroxymethylbilane synthase [Campylobacter insulaenigrae]|uniref:Porphobilinogen deaminase n=2 Tax=Campylobacter insulaenigrae TaxID=260714 RepID=A0A0A8H206_9BACT|nr:hydroxymethylbilane synthase [Campylobacter insulaenigrae]AJC87710.1 hydroxymethylbilane synthase [Campylobacter insulaenigrae NCTC 12927]MCR6570093.1 hydroxymethylbilane synthase [Campylobacter insulaenigrae]MCR6571878.1 hydroxymethylbilane synthase [Campylobacter insulaenigrae]MCR6573136.1 hydroxymethylbilane synthase [Campylobacter insulaenigrae]MCR6574923.1 hydroxymethylbilane synthase [Campylobacter insulaenigrae]
MKLIIATRKSQLALWQSEHIKECLLKNHPHLDIILEGFKTKGDILLDSPLAKIGGKGLFTKELEESMLRGQAHLAVHSLKDVPSFFPEGLTLAAISKREETNDAFLSEYYKDLKALPLGAKVGTTSLRRKMQLLILRPDLNIISLRGNINSRLEKLKAKEFDAIILALAGIKRLNLDKQIKFVKAFELDEMIPAASQGALGIESIDNNQILDLLHCINNENAFIETYIERDFIKTLEGGCQVPIGINAKIIEEKIEIRAIVGLPDASKILKEKIIISKQDYKNAGKTLAKEMIKNGARDILKEAESMI